MKTVKPTDGMCLNESARLEPGVYFVPRGIRIANPGVQLIGEGVTLIGANRTGVGVSIEGAEGVQIEALTLRDYYHGIRAEDCSELAIKNCSITSTAEVAPNTIFLDIWLTADKAYGGAILLATCRESEILSNDLQHQMCGLFTYNCSNILVRNNQCNYNSGFGIHLYETCDSLFEGNSCDYCCRFEPREGGIHFGHMGADSAGFLAVMNSCRNRFVRNTARMGGDGFFLAGLSPDGTPCGCNENLFEQNDASLSPNIAFEATFCEKNIYRNNFADRCNYGFWCGFSKDFIIEGNRMLWNRQAGIAVENGVGFLIEDNHFQSNGHGILLWNHHVPNFLEAYPDRDTSRNWKIQNNRFLDNGIGIRIAADQDHGIRNNASPGPEELHPHSHTITNNDIQDNRIGIELVRTHRNTIRQNRIHKNVEAGIRLDDAQDNEIVNNLGLRGAYL